MSIFRLGNRLSLASRGSVAFALIFMLASCGGGGNSSGSSSGSGIGVSAKVASITVSPSSASIPVGANEQFSAVAKNSSGSVMSGVTFSWSSSSATVATISGSGDVSAKATGTTKITASASGVTSSASTLTVGPALAVTTTSLPGGTVGASYSATLQASGGTRPYTWSVSAGALPSWAKLDPSTGVISGTPNTTGSSSFTVQVTDSESPSVSQNATLSITVSPATTGTSSVLSGQYAFVVSGYDSAMAGSLTLDGNGNVTGGIEDVRAPGTSLSGSGVAISSGTYTVGSDHRGTISYKDANGDSFTFAVSLGGISGGVASRGEMIEFDSNPLEMTGTLALQSSSAFSASALSGGYAFQSSGWDTTPNPDVTVGSFTASGGGLSNGMFDQNDAGTVIAAASFSGSVGTIDSNGRGAMTVTTASGSSMFEVYLISSGSAYLINDASNPDVQSGLVLQQSGGPFSASSLSGNTIIESRGENGMPAPHAMLGQLTFSSGGNATGVVDTNDSGTVSLSQTATLSWSVASSSNGRILITPTGAHTLVGYLIGPNDAFTTTESSVTPGVGTIEPQSAGPFTNASLNGSYSIGTLPLLSPAIGSSGSALNITSGILTFDGNGNLTGGTVDINSSGVPTQGVTAPADTYTVASDGRAPLGSGDAVIWIVSPTKAYLLQTSQGQPSSDNPVIFEAQQ